MVQVFEMNLDNTFTERQTMTKVGVKKTLNCLPTLTKIRRKLNRLLSFSHPYVPFFYSAAFCIAINHFFSYYHDLFYCEDNTAISEPSFIFF